jgi:hypothetical protein
MNCTAEQYSESHQKEFLSSCVYSQITYVRLSFFMFKIGPNLLFHSMSYLLHLVHVLCLSTKRQQIPQDQSIIMFW